MSAAAANPNNRKKLLLSALVLGAGLSYANRYYRANQKDESVRNHYTHNHGYSSGLGLGTAYYHLYPVIHKFLDPEVGHRLAIKSLGFSHFLRRYILGLTDLQSDAVNLNVNLFDKTFTNPVGIAAGFDKNGEAIQGISEQGFGFVEIGSITPQPQPGNEIPRLFRLTEDGAVINRYGFNSQGAAQVKHNLETFQEQQISKPVILGVNLGKNKTSPSAVEDYSQGIQQLGELADYLVINVSSPNTAGLRDLQGKKSLYELLKQCKIDRDQVHQKLAAKNNKKFIPLLVKVAPDLTEQDKLDIAEVIQSLAIDGLIISNTTITRPSTLQSSHRNETGGLSGRPLFEPSTALISDFYQKTKGKIPIIGVGGIENGRQAYDKIKAGASLVQLYSAYSYQGPLLINQIKGELSELVAADGYKSVQEAVGAKMYSINPQNSH
jgi:dihydroorotate dehydrogenase